MYNDKQYKTQYYVLELDKYKMVVYHYLDK